MLKSITFKFLVVVLGILILASLMFGLFIDNLIKNIQIERSKTVVASFVQLHAREFLDPQSFVFGSEQATSGKFTRLLNGLRSLEIVRIKAWDSESRVIFSDDESIIGKVFPENEELKESLEGHIEAEIQEPIKPENVKEAGYAQLLELYVPIYFEDDPEPAGVIEIYFDLKELNGILSKVRKLILIATVLIIASVFTAVWLLFWFLIRKRLALLDAAAHKFAGGDLTARAAVKGQDEIGQLAEAFNVMAAKLTKLYEGLEMKVKDRTKELEKDNKMMVGRELKMVELKKEIENLKRQIKNG